MSKALFEEVRLADAKKAAKVEDDEKVIIFEENDDNRDRKRNGMLMLGPVNYFPDAIVFR
jgi:hypothetical protein